MKTIIITGGTSGIGLSAAKIFIENGYNCAIVGRSKAKGQTAIDSISSSRLHFIGADVSKVCDCDRVIDETIERFGEIHALVNSAGIYVEGAISKVSEDEFDKVIAINVKGTFFMCRAAVEALIKTKGTIVNIASDAGIKGNYGCALYSATKGAVVALTKSLALELANVPVRVNCVAPGDVLTAMTQTQDQAIDMLASVYPMQRIATAQEVAEAIYFLASEKASYITGAILSVDGGLTA